MEVHYVCSKPEGFQLWVWTHWWVPSGVQLGCGLSTHKKVLKVAWQLYPKWRTICEQNILYYMLYYFHLQIWSKLNSRHVEVDLGDLVLECWLLQQMTIISKRMHDLLPSLHARWFLSEITPCGGSCHEKSLKKPYSKQPTAKLSRTIVISSLGESYYCQTLFLSHN